MIALLCAMALGADPGALRQVRPDGVVVDVSTESVSGAADVGPLMVSATYAPGATVAAHIGWRKTLIGEDRVWGLDGIVGVGAAALLATPGVALTAVGELRAGARAQNGEATLGFIVPLAVGLNRPQLAVPLGFEARLAGRLGPVWLGCRAQMGPTFATGGPPAVRAVGGGFVQVGRTAVQAR